MVIFNASDKALCDEGKETRGEPVLALNVTTLFPAHCTCKALFPFPFGEALIKNLGFYQRNISIFMMVNVKEKKREKEKDHQAFQKVSEEK